MLSVIPNSWKVPPNRTYTGLSGVDMSLFYQDISIATVQGYSISMTREMAPIYVSEKSTPFSRDKRGLAGSILFDNISLPEGLNTIKYKNYLTLITIGNHEDGSTCFQIITGIEFLNEGDIFNLIDLKGDCAQQYTFVADSITPWFKL